MAKNKDMYSWWWVSHISPKNSKWLQENLTGNMFFPQCEFLQNVELLIQSWWTLWPDPLLWVWVAVFFPSPDSDPSFLWAEYTEYDDGDVKLLIQ